MRLTLLLLCLCSVLSMQAQQLTGRVMAASSNKPIAFATVGVKGKAMGTTTDEAGRFAFAAPAAVPTDSVIISCIGFRSLRLTLGDLRKTDSVWALQPATQALGEVKVRHGKLMPTVLGRQASSGSAHWSTSIRDVATVTDDERGWEIAAILPMRKSCYLDDFNVYIEKNEFSLIHMRFMLYSVEDGKPERQLLTDDIQFTIPSQQTGWVKVDLSSYNIHVPKGQTVAAGIQWLQGEKSTAEALLLGGPGAFPSAGHRVAVRDKSEAEWRVLPINVSIHLNVQQYD